MNTKVLIASWFLLVSCVVLGTTESLRKLGISAEQATQLVLSSFGLGTPQLPATISKIAANARVTIVEDALQFAKEVTRTPEFSEWWAQFRDGRKPTPPGPPKTMEALRKEQLAKSQRDIDQLKKAMTDVAEDQKAVFKQTIEMMQQSMEQMEATETAHDSEMNMYMLQAYEQSLSEHKQSLAKWEQEYPADGQAFVKLRLQQYLELIKTVDFGAKLKPVDKVMKFVDPKYESKSWLWKSCYRAGKAPNLAAERAVRGWLAELP